MGFSRRLQKVLSEFYATLCLGTCGVDCGLGFGPLELAAKTRRRRRKAPMPRRRSWGMCFGFRWSGLWWFRAELGVLSSDVLVTGIDDYNPPGCHRKPCGGSMGCNKRVQGELH